MATAMKGKEAPSNGAARDEELLALQRVNRQLQKLSPEARVRVMRWLMARAEDDARKASQPRSMDDPFAG